MVSDIAFKEFSIGNVKGREVHIKIIDGSVLGPESQIIAKYRVQRLRMFFQGRRFYLLLVVLPGEEIDTPAIDNYLNSFVVK